MIAMVHNASSTVPMTHRVRPALAVALLCTGLAACNTADRLSQIGATPALSAIEDPTSQAGYKPVRLPMPEVQPVSYAPNSLWRTGSRAFFKDQRAARIGDLVTVKVNVTDKANLNNETKRSRSNAEGFGLPNAFGLEKSAGIAAAGIAADKLSRKITRSNKVSVTRSTISTVGGGALAGATTSAVATTASLVGLSTVATAAAPVVIPAVIVASGIGLLCSLFE